MEKDVKKTEDQGKHGYFALEGLDKHVLFVFMQEKSLNTPVFFYYDWKGKTISERIHKVEKITYQNWRDVTLSLKGGTPKKLPTVAPNWMRKLTKGTEFIPQTHCNITKKDSSAEEYTLTCQVSGQSWTQNVKKDQITFSEKTSKAKK
ncbi:hypothetical protein OVS_01345 [Mycoplasma ovis str. Michigan]|uniref:Ig-like domain-containing protein n=1 Tax=Mycoplasma ovis str. Michigan TaxID=1415773 RepID=A0ABN4BR71_9MOLU|nr:hypothetical protein OVS_01345 [Mycoplasma ovis str. Michigan]